MHLKVYRPDAPVLTTQFLIEGDPLNARDGVLRALGPADQARVLARLERDAGGWRTRFDLVVG